MLWIRVVLGMFKLWGMAVATRWDVAWSGWLTAIVFTGVWGLGFYLLTNVVPARRERLRSLNLVYREMCVNLGLIAECRQNPVFLRLINLRFFDQVGIKVVLDLSEPAGQGLAAVYRAFELIRSEPQWLERLSSNRDLNDRFSDFLKGATMLTKDQRSGLEKAWADAFGSIESKPLKKTGT